MHTRSAMGEICHRPLGQGDVCHRPACAPNVVACECAAIYAPPRGPKVSETSYERADPKVSEILYEAQKSVTLRARGGGEREGANEWNTGDGQGYRISCAIAQHSNEKAHGPIRACDRLESADSWHESSLQGGRNRVERKAGKGIRRGGRGGGGG